MSIDPRNCLPAARRWADHALTPPMVLVSLAILVLTAGAMPQLDQDLIEPRFVRIATTTVLLLWPLIVGEMLLRMIWIERGVRTRQRFMHMLLVAVAPPFRITLQPISAPGVIWAPLLGWRPMGRRLHRMLEDGFSVPMLFIALMILPALLAEWALHQDLVTWPRLGLALDVASRVIWLAFAVELVVMVASTRRKAYYCFIHWIDLAIVLIPLVPFLGVLRLFRLGETVQAARIIQIARVYRVRALALRGWRGLLFVRGLERFSIWSAEKRLMHLKAQMAKRMEDIGELREYIADIEKQLEQARQARRERVSAKKAADEPAASTVESLARR